MLTNNPFSQVDFSFQKCEPCWLCVFTYFQQVHWLLHVGTTAVSSALDYAQPCYHAVGGAVAAVEGAVHGWSLKSPAIRCASASVVHLDLVMKKFHHILNRENVRGF